MPANVHDGNFEIKNKILITSVSLQGKYVEKLEISQLRKKIQIDAVTEV